MLADSSWEPLLAEGKGTPRSEVAGEGGSLMLCPSPSLSSLLSSRQETRSQGVAGSRPGSPGRTRPCSCAPGGPSGALSSPGTRYPQHLRGARRLTFYSPPGSIRRFPREEARISKKQTEKGGKTRPVTPSPPALAPRLPAEPACKRPRSPERSFGPARSWERRALPWISLSLARSISLCLRNQDALGLGPHPHPQLARGGGGGDEGGERGAGSSGPCPCQPQRGRAVHPSGQRREAHHGAQSSPRSGATLDPEPGGGGGKPVLPPGGGEARVPAASAGWHARATGGG